jgi:O-methyltransferase
MILARTGPMKKMLTRARAAIRRFMFSRPSFRPSIRLARAKAYRMAYALGYWDFYYSLSTQDKPRFDAAAYDPGLRYRLYDHIARTENLCGEALDYLEFGVAGGDSLRWWSQRLTNPESTLTGFDTFRGLPEAWAALPAGTFDQNGVPPDVGDARCTFEIGLVQDTLASFLRRAALKRRLVVLMDLDLYAGTMVALVSLGTFLKRNDILIFDEMANYLDEYKAFQDFLTCYRVDVEYLGSANKFSQVAFKVL